MNPRFRKMRLWEKGLCLFLVAAFLTLTCSCSHPSGQSGGQQGMRGGNASAGETYPAKAYPEETPWWKKPEYEWLIVTLIVIGVGVAAGAAIMIASGSGGLYVNVQK
jgi:hypothetical protein